MEGPSRTGARRGGDLGLEQHSVSPLWSGETSPGETGRGNSEPEAEPWTGPCLEVGPLARTHRARHAAGAQHIFISEGQAAAFGMAHGISGAAAW